MKFSMFTRKRNGRSALNFLKNKFQTLKSKIPSPNSVRKGLKSLPGSVRNRVVSASRRAYNLSTNALTKARMATTFRGNVAAKRNAIQNAARKAREAVVAARKAANDARMANGNKTPNAVKKLNKAANNASKALEVAKENGPVGGFVPIRKFGKRKDTRKNRKNTRKNRKNRKNTRKN